VKASYKNALRKPDAGNLHVRFEEGEGTRRSLALPLIPCVPLYSTPDVSSLARESNSKALMQFDSSPSLTSASEDGRLACQSRVRRDV
jgi:hypothetical protein